MDAAEPNAVLRWPKARPDARRRLICFSYCGAGTTGFRPWGRLLPHDAELALVCYPGREMRADEDPAETWQELIADATATTEGLADRPYVLFGHSLGAWVAFETALHMERSGYRPPTAVAVSAADAPTAWACHATKPPTVHDTDGELLGWLLTAGQLPAEVAEEPELVEIALWLMRADLRAAAGYRHVPGTVIDAPIQALYGAADPDVDRAVAGEWRHLTRSSFTTTELPGGHFYTEETWNRLPAYLIHLT